MDIKSFVIALGGLILTSISLCITLFLTFLTGISIYLTYRARTSPYREALYSKQLDGYVEVYKIINNAYRDAIDFVRAKGEKTIKGKKLHLQIVEKIIALYDKYFDWIGILPEEVIELISSFAEEFREILNTAVDSDTETRFTSAYLIIINEMREIIGTDPLIKETISIIGGYPVIRRKNQ